VEGRIYHTSEDGHDADRATDHDLPVPALPGDAGNVPALRPGRDQPLSGVPSDVHARPAGRELRLLDVGDLVIRTQAGKQKDVVVMAVPHPDLVVQKLTPPPPAVAEAAETTGAA
jgi:hypothetical protein